MLCIGKVRYSLNVFYSDLFFVYSTGMATTLFILCFNSFKIHLKYYIITFIHFGQYF